MPEVSPGLLRAARQDGIADSADDLLLALVTAAIGSAPARSVHGTIIVRGGRDPGVAVVGRFDRATGSRVSELLDQLHEALVSLRYVSYRQAEDDVKVLARKLEHRFGRERLASAHFVGVPRGGAIVVGMLAIALGLRRDQLHSEGGSRGLTVLIDDCGLTGHRIRSLLHDSVWESVAIGLLYAPRGLLDRIEEREFRVEACISARELEDIGPQTFGDGYADWRANWNRRLGGDRYWIGYPEPVAFPWKQPDHTFVNAATGRREPGWQVAPSRLRPAAPGTGGLQVQRQPLAAGPLRPAPELFAFETGQTVVIVHPGHDALLQLDPTASAMWRAMLRGGTVASIVADLTASFDVDATVLDRDVRAFIDDLIGRGLLVIESVQ